MKKLTLVILAAGMGSRYGGLKQLDKMSNDGDTIIDFSIFDAIEAGFTKVVFVVRQSFINEFKELFAAKYKGKIKTDFVCQETDKIPLKFSNKDRVKPWGTGHALLVAKDKIEGNFAVINADDFYGKNAFKVMANQLQKVTEKSVSFSMVGFQLKNTISKNGAVSRGECFVDKTNTLKSIVERTHIDSLNNQLFYINDNGIKVKIDEETIVSMNFWGFTPQIFTFLESHFYRFLETNKNELKKEFFLPSVINELIKNKDALVTVLQSKSKWLGVTYKQDKQYVVAAIKKMKEEGLYPKNM